MILAVLDILSYAIGALAIGAYFYMITRHDAMPFNWVNAFGFVILIDSLIHHAYPAAILNLFFTLVGVIGIVSYYRKKARI